MHAPSVRPFNVALRAPLLTRSAPHLPARSPRDARPVRLAGVSRISAALPPLHPSPQKKGGGAAPKIAGLVLAGFMAGMVGVTPVHAAFGPGAASVTSAPDVDYSDKRLENIEKMSKEKRDQFRKMLFGAQARKEVAVLIKELEERMASNARYDEAADRDLQVLQELGSLSPEQRQQTQAMNTVEQMLRTERDQLLQRQLRDRIELLDKLDKQPQWVSWAAAFMGSVASTLVMHPIDTLKTRSIAVDKVEGDDWSGSGIFPDWSDGELYGEEAGFLSDERVAPRTFLPDSLMEEDGSLGEEDEGQGAVATLALTMASQGIPLEPAVQETLEALEQGAAAGFSEAIAAGPEEGIISLYDGIIANVLKEAPSSALYLGVYEICRTYLSTHTDLSPLPIYLISGGMGEMFASIIRVPAETVKTRVQTGEQAGDAFKNLIFDDQVRANALRSWSASLFRDVPMGAIQIALFETIKTFIIESPNINIDVSTLWAEALLGGFGGAIGALVTTPGDVVTTRIITQPEGRNEGAIQMIKRLSDEGGMGALWAGTLERVAYWAPAIGIFLSVYCSLRQYALQVL